ncbi:MAG: hypothetical protein GYA15_10425 [Leptolinea sp.]|jgi:hypothetical protein|nr:hypothetical protein [Leptolinea sp.]
MSFRNICLILLLLPGLLLLSACTGAGSSAAGPEKAVETYLNALVNQDVNRLVTVSCKAWEEKARLEADSFQAVKARLEGMTCSKAGEEGASVKVACTGKIVATYGNEDQEIPLDRRPYLVSQEGGEWRMCGYTK